MMDRHQPVGLTATLRRWYGNCVVAVTNGAALSAIRASVELGMKPVCWHCLRQAAYQYTTQDKPGYLAHIYECPGCGRQMQRTVLQPALQPVITLRQTSTL